MGGIKNRRIEKILFSLIFVWLGVEKWKDRKNELEKMYSYTLVKELCQIILKKKVTNNHTKKSNHPKFFIK